MSVTCRTHSGSVQTWKRHGIRCKHPAGRNAHIFLKRMFHLHFQLKSAWCASYNIPYRFKANWLFPMRQSFLLPLCAEVFFDGFKNGIGNVEMPASGPDLDCGFVGAVEVRAAADEKPVLFCNPLDVLFLAGGVG